MYWPCLPEFVSVTAYWGCFREVYNGAVTAERSVTRWHLICNFHELRWIEIIEKIPRMGFPQGKHGFIDTILCSKKASICSLKERGLSATSHQWRIGKKIGKTFLKLHLNDFPKEAVGVPWICNEWLFFIFILCPITYGASYHDCEKSTIRD